MKVYELLTILYNIEDMNAEVTIMGMEFDSITVNHTIYFKPKPQKALFSNKDGEYYCKRCHAVIPANMVNKGLTFRGTTYCCECGQRHDWSRGVDIDWSDEDETN